jgi:hypothetical protein
MLPQSEGSVPARFLYCSSMPLVQSRDASSGRGHAQRCHKTYNVNAARPSHAGRASQPNSTYVMEVVPLQVTPVHTVAGGSQGSTLALAWLCHPCVMPVHPVPFVAV